MVAELNIAEITARFAGEWVLLENAQTNEALDVRSGKVIFHSKDRDEVYRQLVALRPHRFAVLYLGSLPEDAAIVL